MICLVIRGPSFEEARAQLREAIKYAPLVELRLDNFSTLDSHALASLQATFPLPMIFTLRTREQGGNYCKPTEEWVRDMHLLDSLKPAYLDIESPLASLLNPLSKVILSHHDFERTPSDLDKIYHLLKRTPASFYKMAFQAHSSVDALRLFSWAQQRPKNLIAISMGPYGHLTRIHGNPFTYAALDEAQKTAPGQLTAETLLKIYHYPKKGALYGLIGDPVDQSLSDQTHNAVFHAQQLHALYLKMPLKAHLLPEFLALALKLPLRGLSVTRPLKEAILPLIPTLDASASACGAVNTLVFDEGRLKGFNTDGSGALHALEAHLSPHQKKIVIIGAGGAARAITHQALQKGAAVTLVNRTLSKAKAIARKLPCKVQNMEEAAREGYDILINTTPLPLPLDPRYILPQTLVMDICTNPKVTPFLFHASKKGCRLVYGYEMFIEQALGQFALWFPQLDLTSAKKVMQKKTLDILSAH